MEKLPSKNENTITVIFANEKEMKLGMPECITAGFISVEAEEKVNRLAEAKEILKNTSAIECSLSYAEKQFAPYNEYI